MNGSSTLARFRQRRRVLVVGMVSALVVVVSVGASLLFAQASSDAGGSQVDTAVAGTPVATFTLPDLNGGTLRLTDFRGSVVVVNFWASWCVPCRQEAGALEALDRKWRPRGVRLVGVVENDTSAAARSFRRRHGVTWPSGIDTERAVGIDFGVRGVPETYVVDRSGHLAGKVLGRLRGGELDAMLADLVAAGARGKARPVQSGQ